jgi:membrane-associated HD superfamily phosphohydrolase
VGVTESGALQGAADTVRSLANMISNPLMSRAFTHFMYLKGTNEKSSIVGGSLFISALSSLMALILYMMITRIGKSSITIDEGKKD